MAKISSFFLAVYLRFFSPVYLMPSLGFMLLSNWISFVGYGIRLSQFLATAFSSTLKGYNNLEAINRGADKSRWFLQYTM